MRLVVGEYVATWRIVVVLGFVRILTRRCLAVLSVYTTRDECPKLDCSRNSNDTSTAPLARGEMMVVVVVFNASENE